MFTSTSPSSSWRHHVQDQEEELVRELMQADDVDAVLARMEGDHYRHISPILRKLNTFDGPKAQRPPQEFPRQQQQQPPQQQQPSLATPRAGQHRLPPPPPPEPSPPSPSHMPDVSFFESRPASRQHVRSAASSSTYQPGRWNNGATRAAGIVDDDASPTAKPPPPLSPSYRGGGGNTNGGDRSYHYDPLEAYRRPATAPAMSEVHEVMPSTPDLEPHYRATIDSWLKPDPDTTTHVDASRQSRYSTAAEQRTNPFTAMTRQSTSAPLEPSAYEAGGGGSMLAPPTPGSPWSSSAGRYHGGGAPSSAAAPAGSRVAPRLSITTASNSPPRASSLSRIKPDTGELENASQSRIARQLQLLRNYRELAELCSNTRDPSVDLFRSLPSEELARLQAEQLQSLPQRETSPITVNNNYYFDSSGERRGSGARSGHSPARSGVSASGGGRPQRLGSGETANALSKTNAWAAPGNSRSVSELFTADSHHGMTSHYPSGASSSQPPRPPLVPTPRVMPLQSPQPSSGPDSPVALPPLSSRGNAGPGGGGGQLAPPSPSRSQRARSHRSRLLDLHYTPTATTEEAGSSYDEDGEAEEDYAGDFLDNDTFGGTMEEEGFYDGVTSRPPPPRIIEREQHRRFPNANGNGGDYSTSAAQPPLSQSSPQLSQLQQQQQQQHQQNSYPGDYVGGPSSLAGVNEPSTNAPYSTGGGNNGGARSSSSVMPPGASRGSDGGRRSVSSAINVLSGEQELRANAQLNNINGGNGAGLDDRRGSQSQPPLQQQHQRRISAFNGNASMPLPGSPHRQQQQHQQQQRRRSLSAGSSPADMLRGGEAHTDPGAISYHDAFPLSNARRGGGGNNNRNQNSSSVRTPSPGNRGVGVRRGNNSTPEKHNGGSGIFGDRQRRPRGEADVPGMRRAGGRGTNNNTRSGRYDEDSEDDSDFLGDGLDRSSDNSEDDTPGNPQLQTHNPHSSAMRKRRQYPGDRARGYDGMSGSRGRHRDGGDEDGTVHTPRNMNRSGQQQQQRRRSGNNTRAYRQRPSEQQQRNSGGRRGSQRKPSSPYFATDGAELNSASTYSYSYTTSSDISDHVAGSYFSPIKEQGRGRGGAAARGRGLSNNGASAAGMRGRGGGRGAAGYRSPQHPEQQQQQQSRGGAYGGQGSRGMGAHNGYRNGSPQRGRGRGGAAGGGGGTMLSSGARSGVGQGRGGLGAMSSGNRYRAAGAAGQRPLSPGGRVGVESGMVSMGGTPPRQNTQPPLDTAVRNSPMRGSSTIAAAAMPNGNVVQLPDGRLVPANSPAGRQYQLWQQQMHPTPGYAGMPPGLGNNPAMMTMAPGGILPPSQQLPSAGYDLYSPAAASVTSRPPPAMSIATSPSRGGRGASPSAAVSSVAPGRSVSPGGGAGAHIHPGLLYGSLLPKARPKTALVVESDAQGRERSVDPHGDAQHEPVVNPGSVCPVQPAGPSVLPPPRPFNATGAPQLDVFPFTGAINGATANGVQPLAWKSGGSGCVVGRSGHVPPAPSNKLSSHYAAAGAQQQQQLRSGAASVVNMGVSPYVPYQPHDPVSILQQQQHYVPLRPTTTSGRRDSMYSLSSNAHGAPQMPQQQQRAAVSVNPQQRYVPLQEPLEAPRGSSRVDPYSSSAGRAVASRNANVQRFGIAALPS